MKDVEVIANATVDYDALETWKIAKIFGIDDNRKKL